MCSLLDRNGHAQLADMQVDCGLNVGPWKLHFTVRWRRLQATVTNGRRKLETSKKKRKRWTLFFPIFVQYKFNIHLALVYIGDIYLVIWPSVRTVDLVIFASPAARQICNSVNRAHLGPYATR